MKTKIEKFLKRLTPMSVGICGKVNPDNEEEIIVEKADVKKAMDSVTPNGWVMISAGICFISGIIVGAIFSSNK